MGAYLFLLGLSGQALFHFAFRAWKLRHYPGFFSFFLLQLSLVAWILCYLGEQLDPERAELWFLLKFLPICVVPPSWFLFALVYTKAHRGPLRLWYLVYGWSALVPFVALTNGSHHLFFREVLVRGELVGLNGPVFLFHVAWNYLLVAATMGLLLFYAVKDAKTRAATLTLLGAGLIPWAASILNELTKDPQSGHLLLPINPTLPSFVLSTLIFGWAVFRQRILDPRPLARDKLFTVIPDGLLVLDSEGTVVDLNEPARRILGPQAFGPLGYRLEELETPLKTLAKTQALGREQDEPWELPLETDGEPATYEVRSLGLKDHDGTHGGWLVSLRNRRSRRTLQGMEECGLSRREQESVVILDIGTATVKNHLYNVFRKCSVGSRQELLRVLRVT